MVRPFGGDRGLWSLLTGAVIIDIVLTP